MTTCGTTPGATYVTALPIRLVSSCRTSVGSARTRPRNACSTTGVSSWCVSRRVRATWSTISSRETGCRASSAFWVWVKASRSEIRSDIRSDIRSAEPLIRRTLANRG
ncbi:MAG: hypothetical protein JWP24_2537 [Marmoricola sp.]|jgi:hypothetical protein|nr:hypothetical protein [Marmoricola sp.]